MGADSDKDITDPNRGNTVVRAKQINIDNVIDIKTNQSEQKFKQSGLIVSVSNSLIDSAKSINRLVDAGGDTGSMRMKGMAGVAATLKTKALAAEANSAVDALLSGNLKGVGNTRIQATIGSQKSQSNSSSYTEVNQGSSIDTNNLALIATGAGTDSNININGSNLNVSNNALFQADNDFNVSGVAQNSNTRSNNKSSSTAIGGYASFGQNTSAGITASASRGKGYANSDSTTYANSQINVGGTTTFDIGNDLNIKGGVINTGRAQGTIGGDVNIESLQDTATYDSKQKNMGFSADIDIAGGGAGTTGKPQANMNGLGYGTDSDSDSSVTRAGITGIAGNRDITTDNRAVNRPDYIGDYLFKLGRLA